MALDKEKIQKQAKQILDNFADALESVEKEGKIKDEEHFERDEFERKEGDGTECDAGFKQNLLKNAPAHDDDFVIAETGSWK